MRAFSSSLYNLRLRLVCLPMCSLCSELSVVMVTHDVSDTDSVTAAVDDDDAGLSAPPFIGLITTNSFLATTANQYKNHDHTADVIKQYNNQDHTADVIKQSMKSTIYREPLHRYGIPSGKESLTNWYHC